MDRKKSDSADDDDTLEYVIYAREEFKADTAEARKQLTSLSLSLIGAIWVLLEKNMIAYPELAKLAIVLSIVAISFGVLSKIYRAEHYRAIIRDPSIPDEYTKTAAGRKNKAFSRAMRWVVLLAVIFAFVAMLAPSQETLSALCARFCNAATWR